MSIFIKKCMSFFIIFLFAILSMNVAVAQDNYDDDPYNLTSIASNGHTEVTVGNSGNIFYSLNGKKWIKSNFVAKYNLNFVIWVKHKFIAVGKNGELITSSNGITWSETNLNTNDDLLKIVYINNMCIIIPGHNYYIITPNKNTNLKIFISNDTIKWTSVNLSLYTRSNKQSIIKSDKLHIYDIIYYNNKYIGIFQNADPLLSPITYIGSSADIKNWDCEAQNSQLYSLCSNGKILVAAGNEILTTKDGISWNNVIDADDLSNMCGEYCTACCSSIKWINNKFVAFGLSKNIYYYNNVFCLSSSNSSDWKLTTCNYSIISAGYVRITGVAFNTSNILFTVKETNRNVLTSGWIFKFSNNEISMITYDGKNTNLFLKGKNLFQGTKYNDMFNDILYDGKYFITVGDFAHILIINN